MAPKRACDTCISRKVRCNGSWPCNTCRDAGKQVPCTYLRPVRKRGPKVRRTARQDQDIEPQLGSSELRGYQGSSSVRHNEMGGFSARTCLPQRISKAALVPIVRSYQQYSYSVWPIVNAEALLEHIEDIEPENTRHDVENISCLVTALCAATMAQLHLAPVMDGLWAIDSRVMAQACLRIRSHCESHHEHLDLCGVLVSFFLHVYHAKVNQRTSAMMFIQEAISGARILRLDQRLSRPDVSFYSAQERQLIANRELVFSLLWVSERGYALHLGLSPSYIDPPPLVNLQNYPDPDIHVQGLLDLVKLFTAFDQISVRRQSHVRITSATDLSETEDKLSSLYLGIADHISTRTADCHITREWMRTILWQEALSLGLLSSSAYMGVMTFGFPAQVGRDLLHSLKCFSEKDLLPLGRDQLLKCFEVANSLADTILVTSAGPHPHSGFELGPQDFLHALYQKILPFLEQDSVLNSILRAKSAEALVTAPARLLTMNVGGASLHRHSPRLSNKADSEQKLRQMDTALTSGHFDEGVELPADI